MLIVQKDPQFKSVYAVLCIRWQGSVDASVIILFECNACCYY